MMDNDQEDRTINSSSLAQIDIIDLTNVSPIKPTQSCKRRLESVLPNGNSISINMSHISSRRRRVSSSNKIQSFPVSTSLKTKCKNVTKQTKHTEDTVTLDDTIYISDDDKHYVTESDNGESTPLTCPICFESLCSKLKPTTTRCGHIFCAQCLKTHVLTSKKCPTCKSTITLKSCTRLFL